MTSLGTGVGRDWCSVYYVKSVYTCQIADTYFLIYTICLYIYSQWRSAMLEADAGQADDRGAMRHAIVAAYPVLFSLFELKSSTKAQAYKESHVWPFNSIGLPYASFFPVFAFCAQKYIQIRPLRTQHVVTARLCDKRPHYPVARPTFNLFVL